MAEIRDLDQLSDYLGSCFETLSPQIRKAARYLLAHPDDVALCSMRALSETAALPPVTFVRLARTLGFTNYSGLRGLFQNRLRQNGETQRYSPKARDLQRRDGHNAATALFKEFFGADIDNIERTFDTTSPETLGEAADLIEHAQRVYTLGQRSCYPPAFLFHYVYRLFRTNALLLENHGGTAVDGLRHIGHDDLLIVISVAPYTAEVVHTTRHARDQGARVLAITDDVLSPIARCADETLIASAATPSFFHSITALVALVQALLALLVMRGGDTALAEIELTEHQLSRYRAYWSDTPQSEKPQ